jgi:hypothetical protein
LRGSESYSHFTAQLLKPEDDANEEKPCEKKNSEVCWIRDAIDNA